MLELKLLYPSLGLTCPLATHADGNIWIVRSRNQAAVPPWDLVGSQWLVQLEYALHWGGIGATTRLAPERVSTIEIQIQSQGRRRSDTLKAYVRADTRGGG